jgi:hypothetical protein
MGLNNISLRFMMVLIPQSSHLLRRGLLEVPTEWVFEDEGFSGATLERPGLERVRDLAAEGQIMVTKRRAAFKVIFLGDSARTQPDPCDKETNWQKGRSNPSSHSNR